MQCTVLCLYQICEAGSSWCGRSVSPFLLYGGAWTFRLGVSSHDTKAVTNNNRFWFLCDPELLIPPFFLL